MFQYKPFTEHGKDLNLRVLKERRGIKIRPYTSLSSPPYGDIEFINPDSIYHKPSSSGSPILPSTADAAATAGLLK